MTIVLCIIGMVLMSSARCSTALISHDKVVVSSVPAACVVMFFVFATGTCLFGRYLSKKKGAYFTNEAKDAYLYNDADSAISSGKTGQPDVSKRREWFI